MNGTNPASEPADPLLECGVCLKEIPESAAFTPEGGEYVGHFCGNECYQAFLRKRRAAEGGRDTE
jgi:YHS domain-containing protein